MVFDVGNDVCGCGCIGIINDDSVEGQEGFQIIASVSDKSVIFWCTGVIQVADSLLVS